MELSPLAREKLAKIGEISSEEREKIRLSEELTSLLADYFTEKIGTDELWLRVKKFREDGREFLIKEVQLRLLSAITLGSSSRDFERCRSGILACETLKEQNRYAELELSLSSLQNFRQQYHQEKEAAFNSIKNGIQKQVEMAARQVMRQARNQKISIDIEGSVEASVRGSPQWKNFILEHEKNYGRKFEVSIAEIKKLL